MLTLEPDSPVAVALVIAALACCAGALAGAVLLAARGERGRSRGRETAAALRRAAEFGTVAALLLLLRVVDGLTVITGGFVVAGFAVAEIILSTRRGASSR